MMLSGESSTTAGAVAGARFPDRSADNSNSGGIDLGAWHESSWRQPVARFAITFGFWAAALVAGLWADHGWVRLALVVPLTLASGQLFTLGHDSGHGSLATSPAVNAIVGRLAFLPSAHVFGLWRVHHNIHHRYTNLRGRDFVWRPLTLAEYQVLPDWRRSLHRLYRNRTGAGLGLHYAIELWAPRMLWPRADHELAQRGRLKLDALLLYGLLVSVALSSWAFVARIDPTRADDLQFWASAGVLLFVLPLVGVHWLIGFVIYFNHTHPDIVWYDDPDEWARHAVQLEGSAAQRFARLPNARIMNHTAHHVDPRVPLRRLKSAQQFLVEIFDEQVVSYPWSRDEFDRVLSSCKLYDYETQTWLGYPAVTGMP